jgi:amidase
MLEATRGPESGAPYVAPEPERPYPDEVGAPPGRLRVAFSAASLYGRSVHADNAAAVMDVARLCGDLGHEVVEDAPSFDRDEAVQAFFVQLAAGAATAIDDAGRLAGRPGRPRDFEAPTWMLGQIGRKLSALDLERSRHASLRLGTVLARFFARHDVFLCPTLAHPPVHVGALSPRRLERAGLAFLRAVPAKRLLDRVLAELGAQHLERTANTMLFNQTGVPAMSVPLCADATGFPVGVQFAARFGDEATLFRLAAQLEQARPWFRRRPALG